MYMHIFLLKMFVSLKLSIYIKSHQKESKDKISSNCKTAESGVNSGGVWSNYDYLFMYTIIVIQVEKGKKRMLSHAISFKREEH